MQKPLPKDCNNVTTLVNFQVFDDAALTDQVWHSGWTTDGSVAVPPGYLFDGQDYWWRAQDDDVCVADPVNACNGTANKTNGDSRKLTISQLDLGFDPTWTMWTHDLGNGMKLDTNESNGNLFLKVPLGRIDTSAGKLRFGLSYNSLDSNNNDGLGVGWRLYAGSDSSGGLIPTRASYHTQEDSYKIAFEGGNAQYFSKVAGKLYQSPGTFGGSIREGKGIIDGARQDGGLTYTAPTGDTYTFDTKGDLQGSRNMVSRDTDNSGIGPDFSYAFNSDNNLLSVTGPDTNGHLVAADYVSGSVKLADLTDLAGREWDFHYTDQQVSSFTIHNSATGNDETVSLSYSAQNDLTQVQDAQQTADGVPGWRIAYVHDTAGLLDLYRVASTRAPGAPSAAKETFAYTDFSGQHKAATTVHDVTAVDPRGGYSTGLLLTNPAFYTTNTYFNYAGEPVQQDGPQVQYDSNSTHLSVPERTWAWDSNGNLLCEREPAANQARKACTVNSDGSIDYGGSPSSGYGGSTSSTIYQYANTEPYPLENVTYPTSNVDGTGAQKQIAYTYDGGSSFDGLWGEGFNNPDASGLPAYTGMWNSFQGDMPMGSNAPFAPVNINNPWSLRMTGTLSVPLINNDKTKGATYYFKVISNEGVMLSVGGDVLYNCFGQNTGGQQTDCGHASDGDVSKVLWPGDRTITVELSDLSSGGGTFSLKWHRAGAQGGEPDTLDFVTGADTDPNLALETAHETSSAVNQSGNADLQVHTSYPDDFAKSRQLPSNEIETDLNDSSADPRETDYEYFHSTGQLKSKTLPDPNGHGAALRPQYTYQYNDTNDPGCRSQVEMSGVDANGNNTTSPIDSIKTRNCDKSGYLTHVDQAVRAVQAVSGSHSYDLVTNYARDPLERVLTETDPSGSTTTSQYDRAGHLTRKDVTTGSSTLTTLYSYDTNTGLLTSEVDPDSSGFEDFHSLPSAPPSSPTTTYTYDQAGNQISKTDAAGKTWLTQYDGYNRVYESETPSVSGGALRTFTYHRLTCPRTSGVCSSPASNYFNEQDVVTPDQVTHTTSYDELGEVSSEAITGQDPTTYTYDELGNQKRISQPGVMTGGTPSNPTYGNPIVETKSYDAFGDLISDSQPSPNWISSPSTATTSFKYNADGQLYQTLGPKSTLTSSSNDWADHANDEIDYEYDPAGNMTTLTQAGLTGATADKKFTFTYDDANMMVKAASPGGSHSDGEVRTWIYGLAATNDPVGYPKSSTVGNQTTNYQHDLLGRVTQMQYAGGTTIDSSYDPYGNLWRQIGTWTPPGGSSTSATEQFGYDQVGNMTHADLGSYPKVTLTYDDASRLTNVAEDYNSSTTRSTSYGYFPAANAGGVPQQKGGLQQSVTDPAGQTQDDYDPSGRLSSVTTPFSSTPVTYVYDHTGRVLTRTDPGTRLWSRTYDPRSADLLSQTIVQGTTALQSSTYQHDIAGDTVSDDEEVTGPSGGQATANGIWHYSYDASGRMVTANPPQNAKDGSGNTIQAESYAYDGTGNRTGVTSGSTTVTTNYDSRGVATSSSDGTTYCYDGAGDLTKIETASSCDAGGAVNKARYAYDAWSHMLSVTKNSSSSPDSTYSYDALGRMLTAGSTTYAYQGNTPNRAAAYAGSTEVDYASSPFGPMAQERGSALRFFLKDPRGDIVGLASSGATSANDPMNYTPWGTTLASGWEGTGNNQTLLGFDGDFTDPTSTLTESATRLYDPAQGRFDTQDSMFGDYSDPTSYDQYTYAGDSPVTYSDPSGMVRRPVGGSTTKKPPPPPPPTAPTDPPTSDPYGFYPVYSPGATPKPVDISLPHDPATSCRRPGSQQRCVPRTSDLVLDEHMAAPSSDIGAGEPGIGGEETAGEDPAGGTYAPIKEGSSGGDTAGDRFSESDRQAEAARNRAQSGGRLICVFCHMELGDVFQVDHAQARIFGGNATEDNAQIACTFCNQSKGSGSLPKRINPQAGYYGPLPPPWWPI